VREVLFRLAKGQSKRQGTRSLSGARDAKARHGIISPVAILREDLPDWYKLQCASNAVSPPRLALDTEGGPSLPLLCVPIRRHMAQKHITLSFVLRQSSAFVDASRTSPPGSGPIDDRQV